MPPKFPNASILNAPVKISCIKRSLIAHSGQMKPLQNIEIPTGKSYKHLQSKFSIVHVEIHSDTMT